MRGARRLFPAQGLAYQLFDSAILTLVLASLWYVFTDPSEVTRKALSDTLSQLLAPRTWGWGILVASLIAITCSYLSRGWVLIGYVVLASTCGAWAFSLGFGALVVTGADADVRLKAVASCVLFAWIARGLISNALAHRHVVAADPVTTLRPEDSC